jgi:hypothetical protein
MGRPILVIGIAGDGVADEGVRRLRERGADAIRFDPFDLGRGTRLAIRWDTRGRVASRLTIADRVIDLADLGAVWHRRHRVAASSEITDPAQRAFVDTETERVLTFLWRDLRAPFVPAPLPVIHDGQDKLRQLRLAGALGFDVPATLVTDEPSEALAFWRAQRGRCITKPVSTLSMRLSGLSRTFARFTEPITLRDIAALQSVRLGPTLLQAYVDKRVELRVTVVGERVFAAEIHSQAAAHTRHDWRKYDRGSAPYHVTVLPSEIAARCVAMTRALGLRFGAIDLVLAPDGRYVFLEINPAGEYQWIEAITGMPITDAICDLLIALAAEEEVSR